MSETTNKHALLAVDNESALIPFARELAARDWGIIATYGSDKKLDFNNIEATRLEEYEPDTYFVPDGAPRFSAELEAALEGEGPLVLPGSAVELFAGGSTWGYAVQPEIRFPMINLVYADIPRPFRESNWPVKALESGMRGNRIVVCDESQHKKVLQWLDGLNKDQSESEFLQELYRMADSEVDQWRRADRIRRRGSSATLGAIGIRHTVFPHGETASQPDAAFFADERGNPLAVSRFNLLIGAEKYDDIVALKHLLGAGMRVAAAFDQNTGAVPKIALGAKDGKMYAAGIARDPSEALAKMITSDPEAFAEGLDVLVNFQVTRDMAQQLTDHGLYDIDGANGPLVPHLVAASVDREAIKILRRTEGMRVRTGAALAGMNKHSRYTDPEYKSVPGGMLKTSGDRFLLNFRGPELSTPRIEASEQTKEDFTLACTLGRLGMKHCVTVVSDGQLVGHVSGELNPRAAVRRTLQTVDASRFEGAAVHVGGQFPDKKLAKELAERRIAGLLFSKGGRYDGAIHPELQRQDVSVLTLPENI